MIPYGKQDISEDDIQAVLDVLKSDFLTQGPQVPAFEEVLCAHAHCGHAVAVNSATSALHIACLALGLGPGDWLWTSPLTFVASANVGLYCGAKVDFVDVDPISNNVCPIELEIKLKQAHANNCLPKIFVPVHLSGQPCDMREIKALCDAYSVKVVEDASHAIGAFYGGSPIGSCMYSDITVFSFHPVKIITTAEGGAALTNDPELSKKMILYRSHGITRDEREMVGSPHGSWYYQQIVLGFNYRMTELQAALGISQMERLSDFVAARHEISTRYDYFFRDFPCNTPAHLEDRVSALHLYVVRLQLDKISSNHRDVFEFLRNQNIAVNLHYIPVHLQPYYSELGFEYGDFPNAEKYYAEAISLPIYPGLTYENQQLVVEALGRALKAK